jgi:hypothetical protein
MLCITYTFVRLLQGLPKGAVQNALQRDGLDPSIMDLDPDVSVRSQIGKEKDNDPPLKDDPKYSKYFKMLSMVSNNLVVVLCLHNLVSLEHCAYSSVDLLLRSGTSYGRCQELFAA